MQHHAFHPLSTLPHSLHARARVNMLVAVLCIIFVSGLFASCGSATAVNSSPTPTRAVTPTPRLTSTPTPTHAPKPTPTPQPTVALQPTSPPPVQTAPAILDLRPSSMSIVGHLDCQKNVAFVCFARVLSGSSNQSNLSWFASTNVPGNIAFSPSSGVLAPGESALVTITVPFNSCTSGLFFFRGPANTHTITWAC